MTEVLDLATSFRVNALFYLLMSPTLWLVLRRPMQWPVGVWCLAGLLAGVSVWLISMRGLVDSVWTYLVAQPMLLASYLLYAQSLRMDMGRAWSWRGLVVVLVLYAGVIGWGFGHRHTPGMAMLVRLANSAALLALTLSALALARHERSRNARFIVAGFSIFTASMMANALATWLGQHGLYAMQQGVLNHILGLVSLLTVVMAYMGYLGLALERAQRATARLRQAQWQVRQWRDKAQSLTLLDRQRTLSVLANSLGHDILQPLTATRLNVQLARRMVQSGLADLGAVGPLLGQAVQGLQRSAAMVERIRGFLRPMSGQSSTLVLQSVLQDAHDLLRQELMYRGITLSVQVPAQPVCVHAQALPLTQTLVQVIRNAMQAVLLQQRAVISVSLRVQGEEACIEVRDGGPGLPPRVLAQTHEGVLSSMDWLNGLGLYMAHGILTGFGGRLSLDNPASGGARVQLVLPLLAKAQG